MLIKKVRGAPSKLVDSETIVGSLVLNDYQKSSNRIKDQYNNQDSTGEKYLEYVWLKKLFQSGFGQRELETIKLFLQRKYHYLKEALTDNYPDFLHFSDLLTYIEITPVLDVQRSTSELYPISYRLSQLKKYIQLSEDLCYYENDNYNYAKWLTNEETLLDIRDNSTILQLAKQTSNKLKLK